MNGDGITDSQAILDLLATKGRMFKGAIEDELRITRKTYGDTTSRRLRELTAAGLVVKGEEGGLTYYERPLVTDLASNTASVQIGR
jgi:Mn-dependent DtxR family transcriptional regulator